MDRKTFERLILLVEWCAKELVIYRYQDCNTFLASLDTYLFSDSAEVIGSLGLTVIFLPNQKSKLIRALESCQS
jgi:hypothetical protein